MSYDEQIRRCYSTWSDNYYREYYGTDAPYPPIHREIIRQVLEDSKSTRLLDVGCGPASILRDLDDLNLERYGFDLTPEMVIEADRVLQSQGEPSGRVWQGSILDAAAFKVPDPRDSAPFDAVISVGVLPHLPEGSEKVAFQNIHSALRPEGIALVEARNQLFALFTSNRYTHEFFVNDLINETALRKTLPDAKQNALTTALDELKSNFRMDQPPIRPGKGGEVGYDEVLSRTHNPLLLQEKFREAGFKNVQLLFYHFHCLPPYVGKHLEKEFVTQSVQMENPRDWRGMFMASAFFLYGIA